MKQEANNTCTDAESIVIKIGRAYWRTHRARSPCRLVICNDLIMAFVDRLWVILPQSQPLPSHFQKHIKNFEFLLEIEVRSPKNWVNKLENSCLNKCSSFDKNHLGIMDVSELKTENKQIANKSARDLYGRVAELLKNCIDCRHTSMCIHTVAAILSILFVCQISIAVHAKEMTRCGVCKDCRTVSFGCFCSLARPEKPTKNHYCIQLNTYTRNCSLLYILYV